jgi:adenosine deaminase CECR1
VPYSSSLSHEFYQVMVGDTRMTIHGWRQLIEWSLEHSCLTEAEHAQAQKIFARDWEAFCAGVVRDHGEYADSLKDLV